MENGSQINSFTLKGIVNNCGCKSALFRPVPVTGREPRDLGTGWPALSCSKFFLPNTGAEAQGSPATWPAHRLSLSSFVRTLEKEEEEEAGIRKGESAATDSPI